MSDRSLTGHGPLLAAPAAQAAQQPVRIGQYRLSKTLGIGSFGKVKRESRAVGGSPAFFASAPACV